MAGITRIPRTRGAASGLLLILLGAWGGLVPFVGPYFHFAYTPDRAWAYTTGRLWLEILPGVAVALGGFIVLASARRPLAMFGAFVAALGGAWFVVGNLVSALWNGGTPEAGVPVGGTMARLTLEELGFFLGLGVVIVFFSAVALGRLAVVGVKDAALAERAESLATADTYTAAGSSAGQSDSFPQEDEKFRSAAGSFTGAHGESPTVSGRFPSAESRYPAGQDPFPPGPGSGTTGQA